MDLKALFIGALCATQPLGILAQNGMDDPVLMRVDGQPVSRSEFEAIYKKNNQDAPVTREALDEYLELFINYKLKVREAESLGMDTVQKFEQELAGYRDQLARPYLIDRELNEGLIKEAYDRSRWEVRASHILVQMPTDPTPEDTLAAWERITALRDRVVGGEDFAAVAQGRGGSDDPSVSRNGGDAGWFSAMQMVYPFETAAYSTEIGEVSAPVRTRFGYHIIKVMGKREARGQVKVAHIMLRSTEQDDSTRQADAERRIREVYGKLLAGEVSFDDAALRYSEDEATSTKGGELPMFGTGKMIEEFEDVSFALSEDGEVSAPFRTRFGWHIVKRLEYKPPPSFEQARPELKAKIAKDSRAEVTRQAFLARLLQEYGYVPYTGNLKAVSALLDSNFFKKGTVLMDTLLRSDLQEGEFEREGGPYRRELTGQLVGGQLVNVRSRRYDDLEHAPTDTVIVRDVHMGWSYDRKKAAKLTKPVATFDGVSLDQRSLLDYLERVQQRERPVPYSEVVGERFGDFVDERVLQHENDKLEEKYPEFRLLMKEYRDGILLFELTDEKVWSRAVEDSAGLEAYYDAHRLDFMWEPRFKATLYECADSGTSSKVRSLYRKGKRGGEIANELNTTSALNVRVEEGLWTAQEKPYLQGVIEPGLTNNFEVDGRVVIADLQEVLPAAPKTLEEARGSITAAYQDHLEKVWVDELKAKYPVVVDQDVLYSIR